MPDLFDYVMVDNIFTKEECERYMKKINENEWQTHNWYGHGTDEYSSINDFSVTYDSDVQEWMLETMVKYVGKYLKIHQYLDTQFFSGVKFNKYNIGESMKQHIDHIYCLFDGERKGIPVLSFIGVFNDDYEGGDFMLCGKKIELKQGDCVIFPSVFLYPHEVTPITKGTRYSWVLWSW